MSDHDELNDPIFVRVDLPSSCFHGRIGWLARVDASLVYLVYFPGETKPLRFDREHLVLESSLCLANPA